MKNKIEIENLEELISKYNLNDERDEILKLSEDTIIFITENEDYTNVGNTRFEGYPDLPENYNFNDEKDELIFICQLNLEEIGYSWDKLPQKGMLYIFIYSDYNYYHPKIFYLENIEKTKLKKYIPKEGDKLYCYPEPLKMKEIHKAKTLPFSEDDMNEKKTINVDYEPILEEINEFFDNNVSASIFGYFANQSGIRRINPKTGESIKKRYGETELLFHLQDYKLASVTGGPLYFLINKEDLKNKKFDKVGFFVDYD